jgi:hypothetical protein
VEQRGGLMMAAGRWLLVCLESRDGWMDGCQTADMAEMWYGCQVPARLSLFVSSNVPFFPSLIDSGSQSDGTRESFNLVGPTVRVERRGSEAKKHQESRTPPLWLRYLLLVWCSGLWVCPANSEPSTPWHAGGFPASRSLSSSVSLARWTAGVTGGKGRDAGDLFRRQRRSVFCWISRAGSPLC